eukprot:269950_1
MICLQFYGNIIMNSNILNINQINTIQYVLTSKSNICNNKHFYLKKICDSQNDGFDAQKIDSKYNKCESSLMIIKTNGGYIASCYYVKPLGIIEMCNEINTNCIGCVLQSPISVIPFVNNAGVMGQTFHFPNYFEANRAEKLSDVTNGSNIQVDLNDIRKMTEIKDLIDQMTIAQFEVFTNV